MSSRYLFNNEALSTVALGSFSKAHEELDIALAAVVLPFLLHEPTVRNLNSSSNKRSIEEFIAQYPECLVTFNDRYKDFLPLTINAITILNEAEVIKVNRDKIRFNNRQFSPVNVGKRADRVIKAAQTLSNLLKLERTNLLYLKLKIQL